MAGLDREVNMSRYTELTARPKVGRLGRFLFPDYVVRVPSSDRLPTDSPSVAPSPREEDLLLEQLRARLKKAELAAQKQRILHGQPSGETLDEVVRLKYEINKLCDLQCN